MRTWKSPGIGTKRWECTQLDQRWRSIFFKIWIISSISEDLRSEINTTTSAINTECETCPPRICASTSLTLPSSYPLLSSKDLFSHCKKPLFPSVFLFSTRALCNSPVLPLLCFSEVAERVRERERAADSGRERHGDRKEGGYASMWGRVALQSLAKIAVTHY